MKSVIKLTLVSLSFFFLTQTCAAQENGEFSYNGLLWNLKGSVVLPDSVGRAVSLQINKNRYRRNTGFRIRIFFDNRQDARPVADNLAEEFKGLYPDVPVYKQYVTPYWKVTVGDFRTKSDAMRFMVQLSSKYPSAFLVRESLASSGM